MQDYLRAPFNVRPVVLIANFGQELIGEKQPLQLIGGGERGDKRCPLIRTSALGPALLANHF